MSVDHYENFPVASFLLPAKLRPAVKNIYAFARTADDIADEGSATFAERSKQLQSWQKAIYALFIEQDYQSYLNNDEIKIFTRLEQTIHEYKLPIEPFIDLLSAFEQDLSVKTYNNRADLLHYCQRSANPVGLLMLHLYQAATTENIEQSNAICTGLQLVNFCQDISIDFAKQRCYIPLEDLAQYNLDLYQLKQVCNTAPQQLSKPWQALIKDQAIYAKQLLLQGAPLAWRLSGRIAWELRLVIHGGLRVLEKLAQQQYNPFAIRPMIAKQDRYLLCWRAIRKPSLQIYNRIL